MPVIKAFFMRLGPIEWLQEKRGNRESRSQAGSSLCVRLDCDCDQAISAARAVAPVKHGKQQRTAQQHEWKNQEWIPQLSRRPALPGKKSGDDRRGRPECGGDLPDFDVTEPALLQQISQRVLRIVRDVKRNVPVDTPPSKDGPQPALAVGEANPYLAIGLQ